ncbi:MAG: enoyl-CoA hydratase/isomerase family protein [Deltaproteobacteria bacterium]|nr:enoyl-CoA hydratase/isomerase family protein [Deltaproteobacteria bacterium]MBW2360633.1 enoyl-CoA hydratase/isomerase family protein [Deltaproteobacteria bacterium]
MSSETDPVLFDLADDGVATITLNRPEVLNAFGSGMPALLEKYYRRCDTDDAVRAVVLTGAGRAFCSGADMTDAANTFDLTNIGGANNFSAAAVDFPAFRVRKLMIAAVNGHAIGVGMTLALQCDVRLFAREGKYGTVQVRRGAMPDAYAHWTVSRAVGVARAAELLLTGQMFSGEEIERFGVASQVLPAAEVLPTARALATDVATHAAPLSVALSKRLLWQAQSLSPEEVEREETRLHLHLFAQPDAIEGPVAFMQKRTPEWKSKVSRDWPDPED